MTLFFEKPIITSYQVEIKPDCKDAFISWQAEFNQNVVNAEGFVSLEFSSPSENQKKWVIVQRFINAATFSEWYNSIVYISQIEKLKTLAVNRDVEEKDESNLKGSITEIFVTEVTPGMEENYRIWSAKIHRIEASFPGFRGVYVQSSGVRSNQWITLLQFDTIENLERWLQSSEREKILKEASALTTFMESHRVISPYAGWFATIAKTGELPPVWKQTMLVLLVLFPIVMLEQKFLSPLTTDLNFSVSTFIGNMLSVSLISFPLMPISIRFLGWWLSSHCWKTSLQGTLLVGLLYLIEIVVFWNFF